jgi:hypothetical protein
MTHPKLGNSITFKELETVKHELINSGRLNTKDKNFQVLHDV